jgi:hypothetical protein
MLKDDFKDILKEFGNKILLVRQGNQLRCSCWSEKNQEADRECPSCFGLGMVPIIEKHTVRSQVMSIPQTLPRAISPGSPGEMISSGKAFYFLPDVLVKIKDLVVEVDWSPSGKPIYNGSDICEVNFIDPKRFENGQLTFLKVFVAGQAIEKQIRGIRIANTNGIKNYEII